MMQVTPLRGLRRPNTQWHGHGAVQRPICRASRQPSSRLNEASPQLDKGSQLAHVAKALEHVSSAVALVAHARAAVIGLQGASLQSPPQRQGPVVAVQPADHLAFRGPTPHPLAGLWLTLPLLLAFLFHKLHAALTAGRASSSRTAHMSEEAAARLLRLEALSTQQQQGLEVLGKQMEKLRARVRVVGRDLTAPLKQAEQGVAQQAEVLVGVTQRLQQVEQGVRDTQDLVAGMQGVSAKQFELIRQVIERQKEQQQHRPQRLPASGAQAQQHAMRKPSISISGADGAKKAAHGRAAPESPSRRPSQRAPWPAAAPATAASMPARAAPTAGSNGSGPDLDEWGRQRVPVPPSATPTPTAARSPTPPLGGAAEGAAAVEGLAQEEAAPAPSLKSKEPLDVASPLGNAPLGLPTTQPGASVTSRLIHAAVTSSSAWGPPASGGGAPWGPSSPSASARAQAQAPQQSGSGSSSARGGGGWAGSTLGGEAAEEGQQQQQLGLPRPPVRPPSPGLPVASASSSSSNGGSSSGGEAAAPAQPGGLSRAISDILNSDPFYLTEQQMYNMLTKRMRLSDLPSHQGSESGGEGGPQGPQGLGPRPGSPGGGGEGDRGAGGSGVESSQRPGNGGEAVDVVEQLLQQLRAGAFEGAQGEETLRELGLGPGRTLEEGENEEGQQGIGGSSGGSVGGSSGGGSKAGERLPAAAASAKADEGAAAAASAAAGPAGAQPADAGTGEGEHHSSRRVVHHQTDHVTIEERSDGTVLFAFSDEEEGEPSPGGRLGEEEGKGSL